jgi:hypothetical protein
LSSAASLSIADQAAQALPSLPRALAPFTELSVGARPLQSRLSIPMITIIIITFTDRFDEIAFFRFVTPCFSWELASANQRDMN